MPKAESVLGRAVAAWETHFVLHLELTVEMQKVGDP